MRRTITKVLLLKVLGAVLVFALIVPFRVLAASPTTVDLLTAKSFAVLAGTAITNIPTSVIVGNVGLSPAAGSNYSGLTTAQVTGTIYAVDGTGPAGSVNNPGLLTTAKNDLTTAYLDTAGRTPTTTFVAADNQLGGQTLTAGVYRFGHASTANLTAASPLVLDAQGDPTAVFIFQATSDLVTASNSVVQLVNGAQACNVFWQVGSSTTLGTSSTFKGTIMSLTASTITTHANIEGRVLARNAAVTLDANTITVPATCVTTVSSSPSPSPTPTPSSNSSLSANTSVPGLPNTGVNSDATNWLVFAVPLAMISGGVYALRKKRII